MATAKKKPSAKQLAARRKFARMAKSGELQKLAAAGRKKKARARKNQLGPALIGGFGSALGGKLAEFDIEPPKRQNRHPSKLKGRKAPKGFSMPKRKLTRADYNRAYKSHFGAARQKARKEAGFLGGRFSNPKGRHVAGVAPRYQKMYEAIVSSPEAKKHYGPRLKEVAARTVKKAAAAGVNPTVFYRQNPAFFGYLVGGKKKQNSRPHRIAGSHHPAELNRDKRGNRLIKPMRAKGRNPDPAHVYEEFRGKAPSGHIATAPMHGPEGKHIDVAELGKLREIRLASGKVFPFGNGARLCADRNKRLHIAGVRFRPLTQTYNAGPIKSIVYKADKPHIEAGKFDYEHKFGEEGGRRPDFVVDKEGYPYFSGGSYKITSAGIVN